MDRKIWRQTDGTIVAACVINDTLVYFISTDKGGTWTRVEDGGLNG